ncbi:hypothetical protein EU527_04845 [Candidatus Thorarchaeota archaeon]|nr:MAG: hypothetical protein EU527_04845 [Candidatus Thorarchaeota archaeon]
MSKLSKILVEMFKRESEQARFVLEAAKDAEVKFSPYEGMRSLLDLVNHLAQIPIIDFKFYTKEFETFEQVQEWEKKLRRSDIPKLLDVFDDGVKTIMKYIENLSDAEILKNNLKAFYEQGPDKNWAQYLPDTTTHLAMHKMQLWMYLKLAGVPVSMWTYYGVPR